LCEDYHTRIAGLENEKYDLEYEVSKKDYEVSHDHIIIILSLLKLSMAKANKA